METQSNKFLVLAVTSLLLGTLLVFTLWLFDARNGDGNPYLIRFTDAEGKTLNTQQYTRN